MVESSPSSVERESKLDLLKVYSFFARLIDISAISALYSADLRILSNISLKPIVVVICSLVPKISLVARPSNSIIWVIFAMDWFAFLVLSWYRAFIASWQISLESVLMFVIRAMMLLGTLWYFMVGIVCDILAA